MAFEGDVIYAPGFSGSETSTPKEILKSQVGLVQHGGTVTPGQGDLPEGTGMKLDSATKRYVKATAAADVVSFLRIGISTGDSSALPRQGVMVFHGELAASKLLINGVAPVAADATAMGAKLNTDLDSFWF